MQQVDWITASEAVRMTGLSHRAILQLVGSGRLNGTSIDNRVLITSTSLERLKRSMQLAGSLEEGRQ